MQISDTQQGQPSTEEQMVTTIAGTEFKVIDGVICSPNIKGEYTNRYPEYPCRTRELFEQSASDIYRNHW